MSLIGEALRTGQRFWRNGYRYAKAGVVPLDLKPASAMPDTLFPTRDPEGSACLMVALDAVNTRYGRLIINPAVAGLTRAWGMRRQRLSPRHTTHLDEVLHVRA